MSSNTKWTPGQLAYIDALCKTHHQPTYSEMAEALMAYAETAHECLTPGDGCLVCLAVRLRGIGASDE